MSAANWTVIVQHATYVRTSTSPMSGQQAGIGATAILVATRPFHCFQSRRVGGFVSIQPIETNHPGVASAADELVTH